MKTTVDVADELLERAREHARRTGQPVRALVEEGLRLVLQQVERQPAPFRLPDRSVGVPGNGNPVEAFSWQDLRDEIYRGR
jgi:hypothetical protein